MATFVRLVKLTDQGIRNVAHLKQLLGEAEGVLEQVGGKIVTAYVTLGPWDLIAIVEAPDENAMAKASALIAATGNFSALTMSAVSVKDFAASLQS